MFGYCIKSGLDLQPIQENSVYTLCISFIKTNLYVTASYDWLLPEAKGHASGYVIDLVAFLQSTFMSFTNLPVSISITYVVL